MRILIAEDSPIIRGALKTSLSREGYACDIAEDGEQARQYLTMFSYDLLVLDLMMPGLDGWQVLKLLSGRPARPRVLVLSARDAIADRVSALDAGADDYLVKPFALTELLARLRALVRRPLASPEVPEALTLDRLVLDLRMRVARFEDRDLQLSPKEFALLEILIRRRGQVLSRAQIFEHLYNSETGASDKAIEVIMSTLRAKLQRAGAGDPVRTRRGFGYVVE